MKHIITSLSLAAAVLGLTGCETAYYPAPPPVVVDHPVPPAGSGGSGYIGSGSGGSTDYTPTAVVDGCEGMPEEGLCAGDYLQFCADGQVQTYYCPEYGRVCAWDTEYLWYECLPPGVGTDGPPVTEPPITEPPVTEPPVGECGDITYEGVCDGEVLTFCEDDALTTLDCGASGQICTWDSDGSYYDCVNPETPPVEPTDGCGDVTFEGQCEADGSVSWCENDAVQNKTCDAGCAFDDTNGYYDCVADDGSGSNTDSDCGDVSFEGMCDGSTVYWCENDALQSETCSGTCGFDDANGYYGCLD